MSIRTFLAVAASGLFAIAACASKPEAPQDANLASTIDRHKIMVMQSAETLEVPVEAGDALLSEPMKRRIATFARRYSGMGHGALVLSTPSGSPNADAASRIAHSVRLELANSGIPFAAVAGSTYDAEDAEKAPIILTFTRFDAQAPECAPLWRQDLADVYTNSAWASFGCSVQANLAAMIADPADLLSPREEDPRDAARRAVVLDAYRKGQQTHANRSSDERVAVSNAIQ